MLLDQRRSGVLLHPTSLPGPHGIGDLGASARAFIDLLAAAHQSLWQVLPLGPTGYGDSPYASPSAFAGNPLLIAPDALVQSGLLAPGELDALNSLPSDHVDFAALHPLKDQVLHAAFARGRDQFRAEIEAFRRDNASWVDDYALFSALREQRGVAWTEWDDALRTRQPAALGEARDAVREAVDYHLFIQWLFHQQWDSLLHYAHAHGISLIGDIPIFVAHDSADVWAHQHLFKLDERGVPTVVAGVPPDYFSATGQLWGNPLYDWEALARDGYGWWIDRFRALLGLVDLVRIDHFRGFEAAWEVPRSAATAVDGRWVKGPGAAVFDAIGLAIGGGQLPVIAEDLGVITDDVRKVLRETRFPGMKVLQFAFGDTPNNPYLPHNYLDANCVVYTGTHDNDTTRGWFENAATENERAYVRRYLGNDGGPIAEAFIRLALESVANTAIVPMQDVLNLGSEARMNTPGAADGNWAWRAQSEALQLDRAACLADLTQSSGRGSRQS